MENSKIEIMETDRRLINPIARVYIEKGLWNSDFEILFRKHYEKEEEEQDKRETERRIGREAPGSSTDYTVPHNMMRDKESEDMETDPPQDRRNRTAPPEALARYSSGSRPDLQERKRLAERGRLQGGIQGTGQGQGRIQREGPGQGRIQGGIQR